MKRFDKIYVLGGLIFATSFSFSATAQVEQNEIKQVESITIGQPNYKKNLESIVSVEQSPIAQEVVLVVDARDSIKYNVIRASDEEIKKRLESLENIMPMPYNEHVQKYIDYFLFKRPSFTREMLERKERYFPVFEKYLVKHGIPDEMKYLALLESGLNPKARSHANAVGMWQFMSPTGREMGLKIDGLIDERMDVEKATDASFRYLTQLYNRFGDWELALAAYNTGPGNINRAIRRSGKTDYWSLHNYIHRDTRAYVPQWAALNYLMNYAAEHGIFPDYNKMEYPIQTEKLLVNGYLNLETFAKLNYLDFAALEDVNPHITKREIPSYAKNIELNLPVERYAYFENNKVCILDSASKLPPAKIHIDQIEGPYHIEYVSVKKYHRVRSGDHLNKIADNYNVTVADLKKWNKLRSSKILRGQNIVLYTKEAKKVYHENDNTQAAQENKPVIASSTPTKQRSNVVVANNSESINVIEDKIPNNEGYKNITKTIKRYHKVRRGESLGLIAERLGVGLSEMKKWNKIRNSNDIKYGQSLVYYKTVTEKVYENGKSPNSTIVYTVQKGDTLWNIANKYPHLSIDEIKRINNLSSNTVKVGQKLKLKS